MHTWENNFDPIYFYLFQNTKPKSSGEAADNPTWSILKDSFMIGAKMKDWDKGSDSADSVSDCVSNESDGD